MKNPGYLDAAKDMLKNAKTDLCLAVSAFEKTGGDFKNTIAQLKETIGDIECTVFEIENQEE